MQTVSYSLDNETRQGIERLAKSRKVSRSDIVREMYARMQLETMLEDLRAQAAPRLEELGLRTEEEIATYAKPVKRGSES